MIYSPLLSTIPWLQHGFGTRLDAISQEKMASVRQVHSALVLVAEQTGVAGEADALVTIVPGVAVSVRTADCYPILLADRRNRAVAAIHAGWRGTSAQIVVATLRIMNERFGTQPTDIIAAIGPGIGVCCYEVGSEVAQKFGMRKPGCIDLAAANQNQLITAGVPQKSIDVTGGCTRCDVTRFHSFRRDKEQAGRMISFLEVSSLR